MKNIKIVKRSIFASLPQKGTDNAVGWDIRACFDEEAKNVFEKEKPNIPFEEFLQSYQVILKPFQPIALSTGLSVELPINVEMAVKSRSGLFFKHGILAEGTIDPDYRGEIKIMLINLKQEEFCVQHGERIAQAVFRTVYNNNDLFIECHDLSELSDTNRGTGGFGSTGVK